MADSKIIDINDPESCEGSCQNFLVSLTIDNTSLILTCIIYALTSVRRLQVRGDTIRVRIYATTVSGKCVKGTPSIFFEIFLVVSKRDLNSIQGRAV